MQTERRPLAVWTGWLGILAVLSWATPAHAAVGGGIFIPGGAGGSSFNPAVSNSYNGTFTGNGGGLTNLPGGAGVTGMATNQFTTNVVGAEIVGGLGFAGTTNSGPAYYTNSAGWVRIWGDSVLASNRLTAISSYYTNGVTIYTNAVTGASNVVSAAGWARTSGRQTNAGLAVIGGDTIINETGEIRAGNTIRSYYEIDIYRSAAAAVGVTTASRGLTLQVATGSSGAIGMQPLMGLSWSANTNGDAGANFDTGLHRNSPGVVEINNGTMGNYRALLARNGVFTNTVTGTNGVLVSSNSWVNQPTLAEGQAAFLSSNGVPHVVWKVGGVLTTNNLTATGAADGVGINTNGGSGINNVFTNATLNDASGINTFRPSTREVVNSSGNVVADFDARNLNGTGGNALNWSADGTLVRVFNDLQIDGHLTTPAALVSNTPATDQILVYSSPTTAKATSTISPSAVNTVSFSVSGLYAVTNAITLLQFHASNVPTNNILPSSASGTNWTFCVVGGLPRMIATNYAAAGAFIKCVGETVSAWP